MKVGILTFHSQLNYGGVLQTYALHEAIRGMGHEVVVIDRWLSETNRSLELGFNRFGVAGWCNVCIRSLLGGWELRKFLRVQRTKSFIMGRMHLTPYHFVDWKEAPVNLGVDIIVVGSDQVWRCGVYSDPGPYLLEDAPNIPTISYAASFGMATLPNEQRARYACGLNRFKHISCRESEGVLICKDLGFNAEHVVDPTLLISPERWLSLIRVHGLENRKKLACYFMDGNVPLYIKQLELFANSSGFDVDVFLDSRFCFPIPKSFVQVASRIRVRKIKQHVDAGPMEFLQAIASADYVLTDSFHALMFSAIFHKNVRVIRPNNKERLNMFARIVEFADSYIDGNVIANDIDDAIKAICASDVIRYRDDALGIWRSESYQWLAAALKD